MLEPVVLWEPDVPFLGPWSVDLDGTTPRLVAARERSAKPGLFGTPAPP